jgi:hypothetical protein
MRMKTYSILGSTAAVAAALALSGCSGDDGGTTTPAPETPDAATTPAPAETTPADETPGAQAEIGETINFAGTGETAQIDCETGKSLNVALNDNVLTVTGQCHDVRVGGANNTITLDHVENSIDVAGADNRLTYRTGEPEIQTLGDSNQVSREMS